MIKVGINGFGRIGREALKQIMDLDDVLVVAINDLTDSKQLAYLYKYDSVHRLNKDDVSYDDESIIVNGKKIYTYKESDPANIPWGKHDVDVVLECTGAFTSYEKCEAHLRSGAKRVIISAPSKDDSKTIVYGVNESILNKDDKVISSASCTTNCLAPTLDVINKNYKIKRGFMSTVHAMTNDQEVLDVPHKKGIEGRRGRSASLNIIPTSTGAASAIGKVIPELNNKFDGTAFRVPVGDGSLIDLTLELEESVTKEEINKLFTDNQSDVLKVTTDPVVSSDIIGNRCGSLIDLALTNVIDGNLLKVVAWYDNEIGYTAQMIRTLIYFCNLK